MVLPRFRGGPGRFTQTPASPIAHDSTGRELLPHCKPPAIVRESVLPYADNKKGTVDDGPLAVCSVKLRALAQAAESPGGHALDDREPLAAASAASLQYQATCASGHALQEPVVTLPRDNVRLVSSLRGHGVLRTDKSNESDNHNSMAS